MPRLEDTQTSGAIRVDYFLPIALAAHNMNRLPCYLVSLPKNPVIPGGLLARVKDNQSALGAAHLVQTGQVLFACLVSLLTGAQL